MEPAVVIETHVSWVMLLGDRAYKLKKPVRTGFLDFSTVQRRHQACVEELRVNRRLAPDVYLGVDAVSDEHGAVVDHLVVMRRMPAARRLSTLVASGADMHDAVREVARRIAALHLASEGSTTADEAASMEAILGRWQANHAELVPHATLLADPAAPGRLLELAREYLDGRGRLIGQRVGRGRAVDGHGDLLADDIFVLDDGVRILDAIEFDASLRLGDGLADIAFLAMDLERLGAPHLADVLLRSYQEFTADRWPASLAHHYIAYRAQVRAKVACLRAAQEGRTTAPDADALLALGERHLRAGKVRVVLIGGPPGTGKTTVARQLAEDSGWTLLRSDEMRKQLAGVPALACADGSVATGIYAPTMTHLTYGELLHVTDALLARGESVIIDATWADARWRDEARRLAARTGATLVSIRCVAPPALAEERVRARLQTGGDESDATPEVARDIASRFAPWPEAAEVDTTLSPDELERAAYALVTV